jgi:hypothetical protein
LLKRIRRCDRGGELFQATGSAGPNAIVNALLLR